MSRRQRTYTLDHVGVCRTSTTNLNTDVIEREILASQLTHILFECRGEEKIAMITIFISICRESVMVVRTGQVLLTTTRHDLGEIIFPIRLKHLIGLINNGVAVRNERKLTLIV